MPWRRVEFRILGPLEVRADDLPVPLGGPKQRALLALLLLSANRVVPRDTLLAELSADEVGTDRLRVQVSRLRKTLDLGEAEPRLIARPPGYMLRVERGELDLELFEQSLADGRRAVTEGDLQRAGKLYEAALSLWRGRPLADLEFEPFARLEVERLEEMRLGAVEERIEAALRQGRQTELVPDLERLVAEHPFRERLRGQLMLALYRCGRQAEALEIYRRTRLMLDEELGLEPEVRLQELEKAILVHDSALEADGEGVDRGSGGAPPLEPLVCPFKGLSAFESADAAFFFGRERVVAELIGSLVERSLVGVLGPSGSGKSSLVRAGLLHALAAGALPGSEGWQRALLRPGEHPSVELARVLGGELHDRLAQLQPGERVVVAVDQFEEVFTVCVDEQERRQFLKDLIEAAWDPYGRALIVLAMRADFFGELSGYPELADAVGGSHLLLGPMKETELRRAIESPAAEAGLVVEPELVDALVGDVAGEIGGLPLLSTTLLQLWQERRARTLSLATYVRIGGVHGAVGRLAEAAYSRLDANEQPLARRVLLRLAGSDDGTVTGRRVPIAELELERNREVAQVVRVLIESRLLTASEGTVEMAHEALLTHWPRLREWLEEDAQGRRLHRHLTGTAAEWNRAGRDPGELYRGARLSAAIDWAADHAPDLNRIEHEFLEESLAVSVRATARQRRANRRLRAVLAVALVLLVLSVAAAAVALEKRREARHQATAADAQRLGAQALIDPRLDRSLLLAREGVNLDDSAATRSNLLAALLRSPAAIGVVHNGPDRLLDEALSPDGRTLAVRGDDGNIEFFNSKTLRPLGQRLKGSNQIGLFGAVVGPLHALAFSPDGATLVVGDTNGTNATVDLVGARSHLSRASVTSANAITADVAFAPDGRTVATDEPVTATESPPPAVIVVHDARTGRGRATSSPLPGARLVGYTRDGRSLLVTTGSRKSMLLDAGTLKRDRTFAVGGAAALSPAGEQAAFGSSDGSLKVLNLDSGRERTLAGRSGGSIDAVSFSHDGRKLATGSEDGTASVWSVRSGALLETFDGHSAAVEGAAFGPDGKTLYTVGDDGTLIAWDVAGGRRLGQPFQYGSVRAGLSTWSAVSPDGSLFALSPGPNLVTLWRSGTRTALNPELRGPVGDVHGLAFSRDGKFIAAAGSRNAVLWDTSTKRIVRVLPVGIHGAGPVTFSPDGMTVAIGRYDGIDTLYDLRTGRKKAELVGDGSTQALDFSPDGRLLASASLTGIATVWDVLRSTEVAELRGGVAAFAVRFSPDGKLVAVGDSTGTVSFWDAAKYKAVGRPLAGHNGGVSSIDFDSQARRLVTVSSDGKLRLWDVSTRTLIGAPLPGSTTSGSAEFFPDGKHVLGVFQSGTGIVWNVDPPAWKAAACSTAHRNLTRGEWMEILGHRGYHKVCA
jgi:WD40 repeat protein/DNA-binding SARP family transcriptional activator